MNGELITIGNGIQIVGENVDGVTVIAGDNWYELSKWIDGGDPYELNLSWEQRVENLKRFLSDHPEVHYFGCGSDEDGMYSASYRMDRAAAAAKAAGKTVVICDYLS